MLITMLGVKASWTKGRIMKNKIISALAISLVAVSASSATAGVQTSVGSWGLDRLDQTTTQFDSTYNFPDVAGAGVRVYVMDTGVQSNLTGFGGRVATGFDAIARFREPSRANSDCSGHGTAVAGIIASATYGVAKQATIVPVRVADCRGAVSPDWIIKGIDWIIKNHPRNSAGVVNLSIATTKNKAVDDAVARLYNAGLVPVVSAGNQNFDACQISPASSPRAFVVGSVNQNDFRTNNSNFGECVSIFAPGGLITTEGVNGKPSTRTGTSFSAPHATGAIALYLSKYPTAKPAEVIGEITRNGLSGVVVDAKSTRGNILLNTAFLNK